MWGNNAFDAWKSSRHIWAQRRV
eukprot:SAG11_NODE_46348_length_137_cov_14.710526_1_plen_22_part_01